MAKVRYVMSRLFSTLVVIYLLWKFIVKLSASCVTKGIDPFVGILGWILGIVASLIMVAGLVFVLWLWSPNE